jgi:radical SAM superfamily enzyme YgiQ (UPF0313 family)
MTEPDLDIVFVNPPHHGEDYYSPIGIGMLHSLVREHGLRSRIVDFQRDVMAGSMPWPEGFFEAAEHTLLNTRAHIYGFTIMNVGLPWAVRLARRVRSMNPDATIVFGGPHATLLGEQLISTFSEIDIVVQNEGETVIVPLVQALLSGDSVRLAKVANLIFRDGTKIIKTMTQPLIDDLDTLPYLDVDAELLGKVEILSIEAGRGCPYHCSFCSSHAIWSRRPRFKSATRLVNEAIEYLRIAPPRKEKLIVSFEHDDFLSNRPFFRRFVEEKLASGDPFQYAITARINHITDEVCDLLADSGCVSVFMGLETGSETLQSSSLKHLKVCDIIPRVQAIRSRDIHVSTNFILGFPDETWSDLYNTVALMLAVNRLGASINISIMCPEPGSRLYDVVPSNKHVVLYEGEYVEELVRGGILIEDLTAVESFHLKTIESDIYDIRAVARFAESLQFLMTEFPLSLARLVGRRGRGAKDLVELIFKFQHSNGAAISDTTVFGFFDAHIASDMDGRSAEFLLFECARSSIKHSGRTTIRPASFSEDTSVAYYRSLQKLCQGTEFTNNTHADLSLSEGSEL